MGIMVRVTSVIKNREGDIIAVRGKEENTWKDTKENTWQASFIYDPLRSDDQSSHRFSVMTPDGMGEVIINCGKKNEKLHLYADLDGINLLEKLPLYST